AVDTGGEPIIRQRNVTVCARVTESSGLKSPVSPTPMVIPSSTSQATAEAYHEVGGTSGNGAAPPNVNLVDHSARLSGTRALMVLRNWFPVTRLVVVPTISIVALSVRPETPTPPTIRTSRTLLTPNHEPISRSVYSRVQAWRGEMLSVGSGTPRRYGIVATHTYSLFSV